MKKNLLIFSVLVISFLLAEIVSLFISFEESKLVLRRETTEEIKQKIQDTLAKIKKEPNPTISLLPAISETPFPKEGNVVDLAQCLKEKKYTMYGTTDCSSCALEKSYFGESFALIPYVDCGQESKICETKKIHAYPTWEDKDGNQYKGAMPLSTLAGLSGCPVPN